MKKTINILTTSILCLSMISCSAPGNSPQENAADNSSAETVVEVSSEAPTAEDPTAESSSEEIDYTTGTPWMNVDLIGNVTADTPTDPKDNYALWANKDRKGISQPETLLI